MSSKSLKRSLYRFLKKTILAKTILLVAKIYYKKKQYKKADQLIQIGLSAAQETITLEQSHRALLYHLQIAEKEIQKRIS